ncbi:MAG: beta-ketoacyl-[acyl-carrier-protein] synthase family protein [Jatrophihabitans sp.]|nr:beta-ketoacyl-[acyl-carrier-protein] synthase family protein [Jatrophihabitans sp.]
MTGLGVASPIGTSVPTFWASVTAGHSGIGPIVGMSADGFMTTVGAQVQEVGTPPGRGRAAALASIAGAEALGQAGIDAAGRGRVGLVLGTTMGEASWIESWPDADGVLPEVPASRQAELARSGPAAITADVAATLGLGGRTLTLGAACAGGNYAIGRAADWIRAGRAEVVLACGADAFSRTALAGFGRLGALASKSCRPFSADRDGLVLGEGAGVLVLEAEEHAVARGAAVLGFVAGFGLACDAHHIVSPHPDGAGMARAIAAALREAAISTEEVGWFCAHGTATPANDPAEIAAVRAVFGSAPRQVPVSSVKALTGHGLGAASAIEAVCCLLALRDGLVPPTWGLQAGDPACAWDLVTDEPRAGRVEVVLNNSAAFGGNNAAVVFSSVARGAA